MLPIAYNAKQAIIFKIISVILVEFKAVKCAIYQPVCCVTVTII